VHPFPAYPARGKERESGTRRLAALTVGHATVERLPCSWRRVSLLNSKATSYEADIAYAPFLRIALVPIVP